MRILSFVKMTIHFYNGALYFLWEKKYVQEEMPENLFFLV